MIAKTDTQHYTDIADAVRYSKDGSAYESDLDRARAEIDSDNNKFEDIDQQLQEINAKLQPHDLSKVDPLVLDFVNDPIVIISGGLDTYHRTISN